MLDLFSKLAKRAWRLASSTFHAALDLGSKQVKRWKQVEHESTFTKESAGSALGFQAKRKRYHAAAQLIMN